MAMIECPSCGEDERLRGDRRGEAIYVVCEACGESWRRDLRKRCAYCSSEDLRYTPIPLWSAGRGTMRTPAGERESYTCNACGAEDATRKA
jgi:transposase-like protein